MQQTLARDSSLCTVNNAVLKPEAESETTNAQTRFLFVQPHQTRRDFPLFNRSGTGTPRQSQCAANAQTRFSFVQHHAGSSALKRSIGGSKRSDAIFLCSTMQIMSLCTTSRKQQTLRRDFPLFNA